MMHIASVFDPSFRAYGRVVDGLDAEKAELLSVLEKTPIPDGTAYVPALPALQNTAACQALCVSCFGGMPVQLGYCNGHNTKLNCLEYHRDSEFNLGTHDFVLLLARRDEIVDGTLDTAKVRAFRVPAGVLVEVYATTLHYAPCHLDNAGFQVLVALPAGTNLEPPAAGDTPEDRLLRARNKWLLAHPDSDEAKDGAYIGLVGTNIDINL